MNSGNVRSSSVLRNLSHRSLLALAAGAAIALAAPAQQSEATPASTPAPATTAQPQGSQPPAAPPPAAQPAAQQNGDTAQRNGNGVYTIRRTSRLVVLDVVVTDKKGNIIPDLKQSDFHVTEADQPQTVLNFNAPGAVTVPAEATIRSTADLDRIAPRAPVNIILLDEFNSRFEDEAFARYSLKKYLEKQPDKLTIPTQLIAVDLSRFVVLQDYTDDKAAIIAALDHHFSANPWRNNGLSWAGERYATAFETLRRVAEAVIGHPGHKNMIWIGRGFPSLNHAVFTVDTDTRIENAVQQCVNELRDARVTLYTVDPAGISPYASSDIFQDPIDQVFGGNYQFSLLAKATGGKAFYGRNDVDAEIGTGARDGANFYTLTYRPTTESMDPQKFRRIRVKVDRPDAVITTREGYFVQLPPTRVNPTNPSRRLASDLYNASNSNMVYDGVPLTLTRSASDESSFTVRVPSRFLAWSLATEAEPRHAEVILTVTTFDKKGKQLSSEAKLIRAAAPRDVAPTGRLERGMDLIYHLKASEKAVRARFVVRVTASGRIGTVDTALPAPASIIAADPAPPPAAPNSQPAVPAPSPQ